MLVSELIEKLEKHLKWFGDTKIIVVSERKTERNITIAKFEIAELSLLTNAETNTNICGIDINTDFLP